MDVGAASDSRILERRIEEQYPHPIASGWMRVGRAGDDFARIKMLESCVNVAARTVLAVCVADYLSGAANDKTDAALRAGLENPADGTLFALLCELEEALRDRTEPPAFAPESTRWLRTERGTPTEAHRALAAFAPLRNDDAHYRTLTDASRRTLAGTMRSLALQFLAGLDWLTGYRMFRVERAKFSRGLFKGKLQFFSGAVELGAPVTTDWAGQLSEDAVFLTNRMGDLALDLTPFVAVAPARTGHDGLFVFSGAKKLGPATLRRDDGDESIERHFEAETTLTVADLIARRRPIKLRVVPDEQGDSLCAPHGPRCSDVGRLLAGRFEVLAELGAGGMARVYRVIDHELPEPGRTWALKVIDGAHVHDPVLARRFLREVTRLRALDHPHIIAFKDQGALEDRRRWLLMPVAEGGTLAGRVGEARGEKEVLGWAESMLGALAYLHGKDIVHRDIKPSNFLLDSSGGVFLSDLGIAKGATDTKLTATGHALGTHGYVAPEVPDGDHDWRSDVWALAVTLHEVLTGVRVATPGVGVAGEFGALLREMGAVGAGERPTAAGALGRVRGMGRARSSTATSARERATETTDDLDFEDFFCSGNNSDSWDEEELGAALKSAGQVASEAEPQEISTPELDDGDADLKTKSDTKAVKDAALALTRVLGRDENNIAARTTLAQLYQDAGLWDLALANWGVLLCTPERMSAGEHEAALVGMGFALIRLSRPAEAAEHLTKALELTPNSIPALKAMSDVMKDAKDWPRLLNIYNNIIYHTQQPADVVEAYHQKAWVLDAKMDLPDKAAQHLEKGLSFDPAQPEAWLRLAELALRRADWRAAQHLASNGSASSPSPARRADQYLSLVAKVAYEAQGMGRPGAAERQAKSLDPSFVVPPRTWALDGRRLICEHLKSILQAAPHLSDDSPPPPELASLDSLPLAIGLSQGNGRMHVLFAAGEPLPTSKQRTLTASKDGQRTIMLKLYQGASDLYVENTLLGTWVFTNAREGRKGEVQIEVTFQVTGDGTIRLLASDKAGRQQVDTRVSPGEGIVAGDLAGSVMTLRPATSRPGGLR